MTISFSGLASGLDTSSWVQSLVALKRAKVTTLETKKENVLTAKDTLSSIKSFFSSFRSTIEKITDSRFNIVSMDLFSQNLATSADLNVLTATATHEAKEATYKIKVDKLATKTNVKSNFRTIVTETSIATTDSLLVKNLGVTAGTMGVTVDGIKHGITITDNDTIGTFIEKLQTIGVDAFYNEMSGVFSMDISEGDIDNSTTGLSIKEKLHLEGVNEGYSSTDRLELTSEEEVWTPANVDTKLRELGVTVDSITIKANGVNNTINITDSTSIGSLITDLQSKNIDCSFSDGIFTLLDAEIVKDANGNSFIQAMGLTDNIYSKSQSTGALSKVTIVTEITTATAATLLKDIGDGTTITDGQTVIVKNSNNEYKTIAVGTSTSIGGLLAEMTNAGLYAAIDSNGVVEITGGTITGGTFDAVSALGLETEPYTAMATGDPLTETIIEYDIVNYDTDLVTDLQVRKGYLKVIDADGNVNYQKIYAGLTIGDLMADLGNMGIQTSLNLETGVLSITGGAFETLTDDEVGSLVANNTIAEPDSAYIQGTDLLECLYGTGVISTDQISVASAYSRTRALTHSVTNVVNATLDTTLGTLGLNNNGTITLDARGETRTVNITTNMTVQGLMDALYAQGIESSWDADFSRITINNATLTNAGTTNFDDVLNLTTEVAGKYVTSTALKSNTTVTVSATTETTFAELGVNSSQQVVLNKEDGTYFTFTVDGTTNLGSFITTLNDQGVTAKLENGVFSIDGGYLTNDVIVEALGLTNVTNGYSNVLGTKVTHTITTTATEDSTLGDIISELNTISSVSGGYTLSFNENTISVSASTTLRQVMDQIHAEGGTVSIDGAGRMHINGGTLTGTVATALGFSSVVNTASVSATGEMLSTLTTVNADATTKLSDIGLGTSTITVKGDDGVTIGTVTTNANMTIGDVLTALAGYGISGTINNGVISLTSDQNRYATGGIIDTWDIGTTIKNYTTTAGVTNTSSTIIAHTSTITANSDTTLSELNITASNITVHGLDGVTVGIVTTSADMTIGDILTALAGYGISGTIKDGKVYLDSEVGNYATGDIMTKFGIGTVSDTITTTIGMTNTSNTVVTATVTKVADMNSLLTDYISPEDNNITVYNSDGSTKTTVSITTAGMTFQGFFNKLNDYGIQGTISDGVVTLTSNDGSYVSGDIISELGVAPVTVGQSYTTTTGTTQTGSSVIQVTTNIVADMDSKVKEYVTNASSSTIDVYDSNGTKRGSITVDNTTSFRAMFDALSSLGIQGTISDGVVTLTSTDGSYATGEILTKMGIETTTAVTKTTVTMGTNESSSAIVTATITKVADMNSLLTEYISPENNTITVYNSDGSTKTTVSITTAGMTFQDFFNKLDDYGIQGTISDGVVTLTSNDGSYVSGDIISELGVAPETEVIETTLTVGYNTTTDKLMTYSTTHIMTTDSTFSQIGMADGGTITVISNGAQRTVSVGGSDTVGEMLIALAGYGISGEITSDGKLKLTGTKDHFITGITGDLAEFGITTGNNATYTTTIETSDISFNTPSSILDKDITNSLNAAATFAQLGMTSNGTISVVSNGTTYTLNVQTNETVDDMLTSLAGLGIYGTIDNNKITLRGDKDAYITDISNNIETALGIATTTSYYTTSTGTVTTGISVTSSAAVTFAEHRVADMNSVIKDFVSLPTNRTITVKSSDGSNVGTVTVDDNTTFKDLFEALDDYGIQGTISDGVVALTSNNGSYATGDVLTSLGINTSVKTSTTTVTVGVSATSSAAITNTTTTFASRSSVITDYITGLTDNTITIYDTSAIAVGTITIENNDNFQDLFEALDDYGIQGTISDGVVTLTSTDGRYATGEALTRMGIGTTTIGTVGVPATDTEPFTYQTTVTITTMAVATESTTLADLGVDGSITIRNSTTNDIIADRTITEEEAETMTLGDILDWINENSDESVTASLINGAISIQNDGAYVSGTLADALGINYISQTIITGTTTVFATETIGRTLSSTTPVTWKEYIETTITPATTTGITLTSSVPVTWQENIETTIPTTLTIPATTTGITLTSSAPVTWQEYIETTIPATTTGITLTSSAPVTWQEWTGEYETIVPDYSDTLADWGYNGSITIGVVETYGSTYYTTVITGSSTLYNIEEGSYNGEEETLSITIDGDGKLSFEVDEGYTLYIDGEYTNPGQQTFQEVFKLCDYSEGVVDSLYSTAAVTKTGAPVYNTFTISMNTTIGEINDQADSMDESVIYIKDIANDTVYATYTVTANTTLNDIDDEIGGYLGIDIDNNGKVTFTPTSSDYYMTIDDDGYFLNSLNISNSLVDTKEQMTTITPATTDWETITVTLSMDTAIGEINNQASSMGQSVIYIKDIDDDTVYATYTVKADTTLNDINDEIGGYLDIYIDITLGNIVRFTPASSDYYMIIDDDGYFLGSLNIDSNNVNTKGQMTTITPASTDWVTTTVTLSMDTAIGEINNQAASMGQSVIYIKDIDNDTVCATCTVTANTTLNEIDDEIGGYYGITIDNGIVTFTPTSPDCYMTIDNDGCFLESLNIDSNAVDTEDQMTTITPERTTVINSTTWVPSTTTLSMDTTIGEINDQAGGMGESVIYIKDIDGDTVYATYTVTADTTLNDINDEIGDYLEIDINNGIVTFTPTSSDYYMTINNDGYFLESLNIDSNNVNTKGQMTTITPATTDWATITVTLSNTTTFGEIEDKAASMGYSTLIVYNLDGTIAGTYTITADKTTNDVNDWLDDNGYGYAEVNSSGIIDISPDRDYYFELSDDGYLNDLLNLQDSTGGYYTTNTTPTDTIINSTTHHYNTSSGIIYYNSISTAETDALMTNDTTLEQIGCSSHKVTIVSHGTQTVLTFKADDTVGDVMDRMEECGIYGHVSDGCISITSYDDNTYIKGSSEGMLLFNNVSDYTVYKANTVGTVAISKTNPLNITTEDLIGGDGPYTLSIVSNGTEHTVSIDADDTYGDVFAALAAYGISGHLYSGSVHLTGTNDSYITYMDDNLKALFKMNIGEGYTYTTDEVTTNVGYNTTSNVIEKDFTVTIDYDTTLGELEIDDAGCMSIVVDGTQHILTWGSDDTLNDMITTLAGYGIAGYISDDGKLILEGDSNSYILDMDNTLRDKLKLAEGPGKTYNTTGVTTTVGISATGDEKTYTTTEYANKDSKIKDYISMPADKTITINYQDGSTATVTIDENATFYDMFNSLGTRGIQGTISDGVVIFTSNNGSYVTGDIIDNLGCGDVLKGEQYTVTIGIAATGSTVNATYTTIAAMDTLVSKCFTIGTDNVITVRANNTGANIGTVTITNDKSFKTVFDELSALGIQATMSDGKIVFTSNNGSYAVGGILTNLGIGVDTDTDTTTVTVGFNTTSGVHSKNTFKENMTSASTFAEIGVTSDQTISIISDGTEYGITINKNDSLDDMLTTLAGLGIHGYVENGRIYLKGDTDAYITHISDGLKTALKLDGTYTTTTTLTSTTTVNTVSDKQNYNTKHNMTTDSTLSQCGMANGGTITVVSHGTQRVVTVNANDTVGEMLIALAGYGISGEITNDGQLSLAGSKDCYVTDITGDLTKFGITTGPDNTYTISVQNATAGFNTTSDQIHSKNTFKENMTSASTFAEVGLSANAYITVNSSGTLYTVTVQTTDTIGEMISSLAGLGIHGSIEDGKLKLIGDNDAYITQMTAELRTDLKLSDTNHTTITHTTRDNTDGTIVQNYTTTNTLTTDDTFADLKLGAGNAHITVMSDGTLHTVTIEATDTVDDILTTLAGLGISGSVSNGRITLAGDDEAYITGITSNVVTALKLGADNYTTTSHTTTTNTNSNQQKETITAVATGTTTLGDLRHADGSALSDFVLDLTTESDAGNETLTHTFTNTDTVYDVIDYLASHGLNAYIDSTGRFAVNSSSLSDFTISGTLGEFLMGSSYTKLYDQGSIDNVSTVLVEETVVNMDNDTLLSKINVTNGNIILYQNGTETTISIDNSKTVGDFRAKLAEYGIDSEIIDGKLMLTGDGVVYLKEATSGASNITEIMGINYPQWSLGDYSQESKDLTDTKTNVISATMDTKIAQLTDNSGDPLGVTAGQIYVYQDGTRNVINIDTNDTLQNLANKLSQYGITMDISSDGKVYFNGDDNSYLTTNGITSGASNILTKFNISNNWSTRYNSTSETLDHEVEDDVKVNGSTRLVDLQDSSGNDLGITTGNYYVYQNGVRTTESITEDTTVDDFKAVLATYGMTADFDESGQLAVGGYNETYLATSETAGDDTNAIDVLFETWNFVNVYTSNDLEIPTSVTVAITETTKLADINEGATYIPGYITVVKDGVQTDIELTAYDTVGDLMDELALYGFESVINGNGQLIIKNTGDSLLQAYNGGGTASNALTILGVELNDWINTNTYSSEIIDVITTDTQTVSADRSTRLSELNLGSPTISTGEYYIYKDGVKYTAYISSDETLGSLIETLETYGIQTSLVDNGNNVVLSIEGSGNCYVAKSSSTNASNVVDKLFTAGSTENYIYTGLEETSSIITHTVAATETTLIKEYNGGSGINESIAITIDGVTSEIQVEADDTIGDLLNKFNILGLNASIKNGYITIQSGYKDFTVNSDTTSVTFDKLNLEFVDELGGYVASNSDVTSSEDVVKTLSAADYANRNTQLKLLNITSGTLTIYRDGEKATINIDSEDTFSDLNSKIAANFGGDVSIEFDANGYLKDGYLTFKSNTPGIRVEVGATTDTSNFAAITGVTRQENGTAKSARELYCVNNSSKITDSGIFVLGDVTTGTFKIGDAEFEITDDTTIANIVSQINASEEANATAYWDSVDGKLVIQSHTTGAALINIEAGSSNFTDILGLTKSEWTAPNTNASVTKMVVDAQELGDNASFAINGTYYTSTSNEISSAVSKIEGVTINLKGISEGEETTLTIEKDKESVANAVSDVVDAYNELIANVDKELAKGAPLADQTTLKFLRNQIRSLMTSSIAGTNVFKNLNQIGITLDEASASNLSTDRIDVLTFNKDKFISAFDSDVNAVKNLLVGTNTTDGVFQSIETAIERALDGGYFTSAERSYNTQISRLDDKIAKAQRTVERYQQMLEAKFASMDLLISQMQNQYSSFLN